MVKGVYDGTGSMGGSLTTVTEPGGDLIQIEKMKKDLDEIPPNFFYSSARIVPTYEPQSNAWTR
uniref:Uncharacterized protein n=1 Tax=Acrobeloides nanus TaxID=290746 RepID=A0A914EP32_9BILA